MAISGTIVFNGMTVTNVALGDAHWSTAYVVLCVHGGQAKGGSWVTNYAPFIREAVIDAYLYLSLMPNEQL